MATSRVRPTNDSLVSRSWEQAARPKVSWAPAWFCRIVGLFTIIGHPVLAAPVLPKGEVRLVTAGPPSEGRYQAGVDIRLSPGALTYWRNPGDAGVPPVFDFSRSTNLAAATVAYPAPRRFMEAGAAAFGYKTRVIFPVDVRPVDASKPVRVVLDLAYALCDEICVPAEAHVDATLRPDAPTTSDAAALAAFTDQVPKTTGDASLSVSTTPTGWHVGIKPALSPAADLFPEPPDSWFFDSKPAADGFDLTLAQKPSDGAFPVELTVTVVDGTQAFERKVTLPAPRS